MEHSKILEICKLVRKRHLAVAEVEELQLRKFFSQLCDLAPGIEDVFCKVKLCQLRSS